MMIYFKRLTSLLCCTLASTTYADSATDLAKKAQNPIENMISVPLDSDFNFGYGEHDRTQYLLYLKPVIPFELNDQWNLITRTLLPLMHQPNAYPGRGYINGIGDMTPTLFLTPAQPGKAIWGAGPAIVLPTATDPQLGQGKYSIGPSFVILTMPGNWVIGGLIYNVWSVGGQSNRANVNQMNFQYFINYNLPHGWYVTSQPVITADWMINKSSNRWVIPLGGGVGHVFSIARQPINLSFQAYNNIKTQIVGPQWTAELNVQLLFPT